MLPMVRLAGFFRLRHSLYSFVCCRDDVLTKAAIGVMGDLADTLGANAAALFKRTVFFKDFLDECTSSDDQQLKETAEWAQGTIARIVSG